MVAKRTLVGAEITIGSIKSASFIPRLLRSPSAVITSGFASNVAERDIGEGTRTKIKRSGWIKMAQIPNLDNTPLNLTSLREQSQKELVNILKNIRGKKCVVIDPKLGGSISLIIQTSLLKEHGVELRYLSAEPIQTDAIKVVYLVRSQLNLMKFISSHVQNEISKGLQREYYVYFVPRRAVACEKILEEEKVHHLLTIGEYPLYMLPLDEDVPNQFHGLEEFDEGKRSCRKRLDGHNRRRRKPQPEPFSRYGTLLSSYQGSQLLPFSSSLVHPSTTVVDPTWTSGVVIKTEAVDFPQNSLFFNPPPATNATAKPFPLFQDHHHLIRSTTSNVDHGKLALHDKLSSSTMHQNSECVLSLLSSTQTNETGLGHGNNVMSPHHLGSIPMLHSSGLDQMGSGFLGMFHHSGSDGSTNQ